MQKWSGGDRMNETSPFNLSLCEAAAQSSNLIEAMGRERPEERSKDRQRNHISHGRPY